MPLMPRSSDRVLCRILASLANRYVLDLPGVSTLATGNDPFILAANHNNRLEAVLLPALLYVYRHGRLIHFLADWPMTLVPGVRHLYRRSGTVLVMGKSARLRSLNRLRPASGGRRGAAFARCRELLASGASVGIFPEGTMNRHPGRLLRGQTGAARLSIASGAPVIPVGIRFPGHPRNRPIGDRAKMVVEIGEPLVPPEHGISEAIERFHHRIMREISPLSRKEWSPRANRRRESYADLELVDSVQSA